MRPYISGNAAGVSARSIFVTAQDGLRLHVREYGLRSASALPVVCLPGLTRTVADFDTLAPALANEQRRVIVIDSRGRGQSDYDRNPDNYNLAVELADLVAVLTALGIGPAVFVGSSRGGLLTLQLGVAHPSLIAGVVLHDIGPVIEQKGLARIKSYVGKMPQPRNFEEGAEILRRLFSGHFPNLTTEQWLAAARRAWQTKNGALKPTYDTRIARTLAAIDIERPLPPLWNEFDALSRVPMLVIRGANSDLLSAATVTAMAARHPGMANIEIPDQGHVPLLEGDDIISRIVDFVSKCGAGNAPQLTRE
jgi:pimeloyl-ACP methyl ester carboxylesterase